MLICISDDVRLLVQPSHTLSSCLQLYSYPKYILDTAPIYHSHLHHIPALFLVPCVCLVLSKKFKCYFNPIWLLFTTILIYALSFFAVLVYIMTFRHIPPNKFFYYELEMEWLWSVYGYPTWVYVAGLTIRAFNRRKSAQLRIANSDQVDGADLKKSST